ncbi:hypothetical protein [Metaclostridioides mangenotii]|uniref:hypothetical protein n=1 Tax=Metaclostridioides mangenotii TaxID=1540 RepID=UPI0026ECE241|nr:hypothetical protein [Clostridioides mangenotii]
MAKYKHKKSKMIIDAIEYHNGLEDGYVDGKPFIYATLGKIKQGVKERDYIATLKDGSKYIFEIEAMKNYRKVEE